MASMCRISRCVRKQMGLLAVRSKAAAMAAPQRPVVWARPDRLQGIRHVSSKSQSRGIAAVSPTKGQQLPNIAEVDFEDLQRLTPAALAKLEEAFMGPKSYGAIAVVNIPGYGEKRRKAFRAGIDLAFSDPEGRKRAAAVSNTYPGWSGTPGSETHPLQSSFLFNTKEEVPNGRVDPLFGKNIFPSEEYRKTWTSLSVPMHDAGVQVMRGCDILVDEAMKKKGCEWSSAGRSLERLAKEGPALASRFICYDSGFTREDRMLEDKDKCFSDVPDLPQTMPPPISLNGKTAGHAGDGLASMRTHSTPVKTAGHAGDGLASMRTHSTPVKTAGHAGDGLASMRTHSTPVKTAGHAGDGLASMRTHSTPVKTAGHAGDGLASMRTHSTPVKTAGHAGDGLASMRTHSTPVKTAGHAGDGLASMRTHSTPVKTAGHAGDGLASMRTHSTPVKTAGHAGDGLASMRTHSTPVKTAGHANDPQATGRTSGGSHSSATARASQSMKSASRAHSTEITPVKVDEDAVVAHANASLVAQSENKDTELGEYWLPWHIDSNFVTVLHREMYASEATAEIVPEPDGAGILLMNKDGDVIKMHGQEDAMVLQMGAFAQIYAGGMLTACRHAVRTPVPPGVARFNFCNFWYAPWTTVCEAPQGTEHTAVSKGWNAMMDETYLDITMRSSFSAFREFMVSPEARAQFADSVQFKELSELFPLPAKKDMPKRTVLENTPYEAELVVDVLTDVRCPFSHLSLANLEKALGNLGLDERVMLRYHPVFLNPNVPKEGESLDTYLLREYGYTKEYAHSENYPIRLQGLEAGINFNPHRRVVNTFDAFCLIAAAQERGLQREVVRALSRRYFECAEDISDEAVLGAAAEEAGLGREEALRTVRDPSFREQVQAEYDTLATRVGEVPHFLLRERISGNGVDAGGNRSVNEWQGLLEQVLEKSRFVGMAVSGPHGKEVWVPEANPSSPLSLALPAQHGWAPEAWPFGDAPFRRMDETADMDMYAEPRFVQHLDEASLERLTGVYRELFRAAPPGFDVLDLCSSWVSHFPQELLQNSRVAVHGLNERELSFNTAATERHVQDLNHNATLPWESGSFDFVTLALSVQYLTDPRAVFSEMHRVLKPGGMAVIAFSHRCFIEKAVEPWAADPNDGEGHVHLISRYFQHGPKLGWKDLCSMDISPRHGDPVWLVTAVRAGDVS